MRGKILFSSLLFSSCVVILQWNKQLYIERRNLVSKCLGEQESWWASDLVSKTYPRWIITHISNKHIFVVYIYFTTVVNLTPSQSTPVIKLPPSLGVHDEPYHVSLVLPEEVLIAPVKQLSETCVVVVEFCSDEDSPSLAPSCQCQFETTRDCINDCWDFCSGSLRSRRR